MKKYIKTYESFIPNSNVDNKLKILRNYIRVLKSHELYNPNINLVPDDEFNHKSGNIDIAIRYFIILHNFLILEEKYQSEVIQANKELNKYLDIKPIKDFDDIMSMFHELYEPNHKVRFAIETFDSIEEIRVYLADNRSVYAKLIRNKK